MNNPDPDELERRVLLLAPTARDAAASKRILEADHVLVDSHSDISTLCTEAARGAGAILLTEEALLTDIGGLVRRLLDGQQPWSDLPLIVLTPSGPERPRASRVFESFSNVTLVKRPVELSVFVATVHAALRDRRRQYEVRDHVANLTRQAAELRAREESLRDADRRKDEFLAMLAHELRNPLAAIGNAAYLISLRRSEEQIGFAGAIITRQVGNLGRLIDDLLDVARVSQGKITLKKSTIQLGKVIEAATHLVQPIVDQKRHTMRAEVSDHDLHFEGDRTRIEQILGNLLTNAAKYTEPGGHIELSAHRDGDAIVLKVEDDGLGIAEEMLPKVFGLFSQANATIDRSQGGLGIGLTLVRSLVEMHGGTVAAQSAGVGFGSTFTVRLPIGVPDAGAGGASASALPSRRKERILVVDDNQDVARITARLLADAGYVVRMAFEGHEALDVARSFRPQAVILDIGLPGLSGYEVATILKHDPSCQAATFIAVTGYGEDAAVQRATEAGFDHHMIKPVDFAELAGLIERV